MSESYDLVIRGGMVADGTGSERMRADVGVKDGKIVAVGDAPGQARETIDAGGLLVTPGFVDPHTHYDGQVTWDTRMQPSSLHGVTTVVMGNCGIGFAPCRPKDRDRLVKLMEGVEDIPEPVLTEGLPWNWETFGDYLDALGARNFDVDVGTQLPHAALRVYAMGERAVAREPGTADDIAFMAAVAKEAIAAGALGFSTSRSINHKAKDGTLTPTLTAEEAELVGIARAVGEARAGVLQMITDFDDPPSDLKLMRAMSVAANRPLSFTLLQKKMLPDGWRDILAMVREAQADHIPIKAQIAPRPVGALLGLELTMHPFLMTPAYQSIVHLPLSERVAAMQKPDMRKRLLVEAPLAPLARSDWSMTFVLDLDRPDYEPDTSDSVGARAKAKGVDPHEEALDVLLQRGGRGMLYLAASNYAQPNLDHTYEMLRDPNTVVGLSDGGAHVGLICDASFPTTLMTLWGRDRSRGPRFTVEELVKKQTADTAALVGLHDRGRIAVGLRADLNVIDLANLRTFAPEVVYDLPTGGRRLMQRAKGYHRTILAGQVTYKDGEHTGALPGRLVRGQKAAA